MKKLLVSLFIRKLFHLIFSLCTARKKNTKHQKKIEKEKLSQIRNRMKGKGNFAVLKESNRAHTLYRLLISKTYSRGKLKVCEQLLCVTYEFLL